MVFYYRHLDTQCHSPPHQGWSRWDSPGGSLSRCVSCWCFSWHGMMMMVTVDIRWCSPGIGDQGGTAEAGHRHTKAGGEAVLGHAGEGVRVLQLGIDDAQSVVGVALAWVDNPTCRIVNRLFIARKMAWLIRIHIVKSLTFTILCDENKELLIPFINILSLNDIFFIPLPLHCCFLYVFATLSCYSNVAPLRIALQSGERKKV